MKDSLSRPARFKTWVASIDWRKFGLALFVIVLTCFPATLEMWDDMQELFNVHISCSPEEVAAPASFSFLGSYRRLFHAPPPHTGDVRAIAIGDSLAVPEGNACPGRLLMADLLTAVAHAGAKVVAVDKFFYPHSCDRQPAETQAFQSVVASYPLPLVLGVDTYEAYYASDPYSCLCVRESLPLPGPNVHQGIITLDSDDLRIPVAWPVHEHPPAQGSPQSQSWHRSFWQYWTGNTGTSGRLSREKSYGFATQAAIQFDPGIRKSIAALSDAEPVEHPYGRLTGENDSVQVIRAEDFLCANAEDAVRKRWVPHCGPLAAPVDVAGKVVVIGAQTTDDTQPVLDTEMYGYELQARYIAALLGGSYLREWPLLAQIAVLLGVIALRERILIVFQLGGRMNLGNWRGLYNKDFAPPQSRKQGWPVIWVLIVICGLTELLLWLPVYLGCLPPIGIMASFLIFLAGDLRYVGVEYVYAEPELALEAKGSGGVRL